MTDSRRERRSRGLPARVGRAVAAVAGDGRHPTPVQEFAARRPGLLALSAGTPIGVVLAVAAWPRLHGVADVVFVGATCALVYAVFALVAYGERARQRYARRLRGGSGGTSPSR